MSGPEGTRPQMKKAGQRGQVMLSSSGNCPARTALVIFSRETWRLPSTFWVIAMVVVWDLDPGSLNQLPDRQLNYSGEKRLDLRRPTIRISARLPLPEGGNRHSGSRSGGVLSHFGHAVRQTQLL